MVSEAPTLDDVCSGSIEVVVQLRMDGRTHGSRWLVPPSRDPRPVDEAVAHALTRMGRELVARVRGRVFVLAPHHRDATWWAEHEGIDPRYRLHYVGSSRTLHGVRLQPEDRIVKLGSWRAHRDAAAIDDALRHLLALSKTPPEVEVIAW